MNIGKIPVHTNTNPNYHINRPEGSILNSFYGKYSWSHVLQVKKFVGNLVPLLKHHDALSHGVGGMNSEKWWEWSEFEVCRYLVTHSTSWGLEFEAACWQGQVQNFDKEREMSGGWIGDMCRWGSTTSIRMNKIEWEGMQGWRSSKVRWGLRKDQIWMEEHV